MQRPNEGHFCSATCWGLSRRIFTECLISGELEALLQRKRREFEVRDRAGIDPPLSYAQQARLAKAGLEPARLRQIRELGSPL